MSERTPRNLKDVGNTLGEYNRWKKEHPIEVLKMNIRQEVYKIKRRIVEKLDENG